MLIGLINNTLNDSWSCNRKVLERRRHFKLFRPPSSMALVEFMDGQKTKLALVEKPKVFLRKCAVQVSVPVVENHSNGYPENISYSIITLCH